jgi:spore germination cell wall hydrolase CwlJ-like protein
VKHKKKKKKKLSVVSAPESLHCVQTEAPATATADPAETALLLYMQSATLATKQKNNYTKQTYNKKVQHSIAIQPETKASVSNKSLDALAILENAIAQPVRKKQKIAARPAFNTVIDDHQETPA